MNQVNSSDEQPSKTIAQLATQGVAVSKLAAGLRAAGLVETLTGPGPYTIFAPSDEAFDKLPHGTLSALMKDKAKLKAVLTYHVVAGQLLAKDIKAGDFKTAEGSTAQIKLSGTSFEINHARVLSTDNLATNGVMHIIDAVLSPRNVSLVADVPA